MTTRWHEKMAVLSAGEMQRLSDADFNFWKPRVLAIFWAFLEATPDWRPKEARFRPLAGFDKARADLDAAYREHCSDDAAVMAAWADVCEVMDSAEPVPQGTVVAVTDSDFETVVLRADGPVLAAFCAPWCGPCRTLAPVLEQVAADMSGTVAVAKLDTDESPHAATRYGVRSLPTMALFKSGDLVATTIGSMPKGRIVAWLAEELEDGNDPDPSTVLPTGPLAAVVEKTQREVSASEAFHAWQDSHASRLKFISQWDGRFRALPSSVWERVARETKTDAGRYHPNYYDCDDFALAFKVDVVRATGVNGVAIVNDDSGDHAYSGLLVADADGGLSWAFFEPQTDRFLGANEIGSGAYAMREGNALL